MSLEDCLTDPDHHLTLAVLPIPNWVMADWQDLHGEKTQGSSSTSDSGVSSQRVTQSAGIHSQLMVLTVATRIQKLDVSLVPQG